MGKDYYKILGVEKNASQEDIKKAFRKKAHQHHPDKQGGDEAKFKELNEAYQVLGDANKRAQYDQFGSAFEHAQAGGGFSGFEGFRDFTNYANGFNMNYEDIGDIFGGLGDIFGFGGGRTRTGTRTRRGQDIQVVMTLEFLEAIFGAEKDLSLNKTVKCDRCNGNRAEPGSKIETCKVCGGSGTATRVQRTILGNMQVRTTCENCRGEGKTYDKLCSQCRGAGVTRSLTNLKVKIPAGIDDGESIRLTGQGEAGEQGGPAGDLYIRIRVKSDKRFERTGETIRSREQISFTQAAIGDKIEIETVDGPVSLKIPESTQGGTVFKLKGKGVPKLHSSGRGDHLVEVIVTVPKKLSKKQKKQLEEIGL